MKPRVCGGSNDNCCYCSGSGYVPDSAPLPRHSHRNPYLGKRFATSRYGADEPPKDSDKILTEFLTAQQERRRKEQALKDEANKRALVGAAFLLLLALIIFFLVNLLRQ